MHVLVLSIDLHLPHCHSRKAKRSVVLSAVRTVDGWKGVAAAETGLLDKWQRAELGVSVVGGSVGHVRDIADSIERYFWTLPGADVVAIERSWWEPD